jgi:hypothetical protein
MSYTVVANSIMGTNSFGLLIDLHIQDYFPVDQAIMYYNYIGIALILLWAAFAGQTNESRYTFTTPFIAALMVFFGWLRAPDVASYWGSIVLCMLLGAFMYINDMNHEKYGLPGPGEKLLTVAFMIMCFTASFGFVVSSQLIPSAAPTGSSNNIMCGKSYQCDSAGNVMLDASVTQISSSGGLGQSVISAVAALPAIMMSLLMMAIIIAGSVLFFSVVLMAAYPVLASSPQTVAFLLVMNVVIWAIYYVAVSKWFTGRISGLDV